MRMEIKLILKMRMTRYFYDITDMSNANPLIIAKLFGKAPSEPEPEELVQKRNKIYRTLYGLPDGTNKITDQDLLKQGARQAGDPAIFRRHDRTERDFRVVAQNTLPHTITQIKRFCVSKIESV